MPRKDEYEDVGIKGIKRRIKDGKYIVSIDLGRQSKINPKTGLVEKKQCKTTKICDTLKEAKAIQGENNKIKQYKQVSGVSRKVLFKKVVADYNAMYSKNWGESYKAQKRNQEKRMLAYFGETDVRKIDTIDIEEFFDWCREPNEVFPNPLSNNTIEKYKTHLNSIWKFMKKGQSRYGVTENVITDADIGEIEDYEATILDAQQLKYLIEYTIKNEKDYAAFSLLCIPALAGLRRGELCGLKWKHIDFEKKLIDVAEQRYQAGSGVVVGVPKMGKNDGKTRFERRQRYSALPDTLATLLKEVKKQQTIYRGHEPLDDDYVYVTKMNMVRGDLPRPGKVSKRFVELQKRCNKVREIQELEPLPIIRLHDLRHTFISLCLNGGVNQFQVSANCGHTYADNHLNTTIKVYWHDNEDRSDIIQFIDKLMEDVDLTILDLSESTLDDEKYNT